MRMDFFYLKVQTNHLIILSNYDLQINCNLHPIILLIDNTIFFRNVNAIMIKKLKLKIYCIDL